MRISNGAHLVQQEQSPLCEIGVQKKEVPFPAGAGNSDIAHMPGK